MGLVFWVTIVGDSLIYAFWACRHRAAFLRSRFEVISRKVEAVLMKPQIITSPKQLCLSSEAPVRSRAKHPHSHRDNLHNHLANN